MANTMIEKRRKVLALSITALNRAGASLRARLNPSFGHQKIVGGVDLAPFLVTGTDKLGRRVKLKGTAEFIIGQLTRNKAPEGKES